MTGEEKSSSPEDTIRPETNSLLLAEYSALRDEIVKRIEIEYQLISLAIIAPGTILAIGLPTRNVSLLLLYPTLALFLAAVQVTNVQGIFDMGDYIKSQIEPRIGLNNIGWEHFKISRNLFFRSVGVLGSGGIFVGTELLIILAALYIAKFTTIEIVFLILAIVSTTLTGIILMSVGINRYLKQVNKHDHL